MLFRFTSVCTAVLLGFLASSVTFGASILQILPTRVVFDDNKRTADIFLKNRGDNDGEYRVSLRNQRMTVEGRFEIIEKGQEAEDELLADKMVRYAPRRVSISKNLAAEAQTVRLALRKPKNLPDGEYRTHLLVTSIPKASPDAQSEISIFATVEISIPVIVRHGDLSAKVSISEAAVQKNEKNENIVVFKLHREGNRSIYGDIEVTQQRDGQAQRLAFMAGMSIYTPTQYRLVQVPLAGYQPGSAVTIRFNENPTYGGTETAQLEFK